MGKGGQRKGQDATQEHLRSISARHEGNPGLVFAGEELGMWSSP
jgi:hypothetical protein